MTVMRCGALMRGQSEGACGGSCARWARAGRGAWLAVRLKAYPDANLFRSERESYVAQSGETRGTAACPGNDWRAKQIPHR